MALTYLCSCVAQIVAKRRLEYGGFIHNATNGPLTTLSFTVIVQLCDPEAKETDVIHQKLLMKNSFQ